MTTKSKKTKLKKTTDKFKLDPNSVVFNFNPVNKEVGDFVNPVYDYKLKEPYKANLGLVGYGQGTVYLNQVLTPKETKELKKIMTKLKKALLKRADEEFTQVVLHKNKKVVDVTVKGSND